MSKKVFLGVGHGGNDPGAVANGVKEADMNLVSATACAEVLRSRGVGVQMSRTRDENDPIEDEIRECNMYRPDLAVDFHNNAGGGDGFEAFYSVQQSYTKGVDLELARNIEAAVKAGGQNSRGLKTKIRSDGRDYFGFIRELICPSIIIEGCFVDNIKDIQDFKSIAQQQAYGRAVANGILKTLGLASVGGTTVTPPTPPPPTPPTPGTSKEEYKINEYPENGRCTICVREGVYFYDKPYISKITGAYEYNESVYYDRVVITNKYVYISWISASTGNRRYMPVKDKSTGERWGNCV